MKKRLISMLLALLAVMGLLPTAAFAASTPEEALGEVQIYNGGVENVLSVHQWADQIPNLHLLQL